MTHFVSLHCKADAFIGHISQIYTIGSEGFDSILTLQTFSLPQSRAAPLHCKSDWKSMPEVPVQLRPLPAARSSTLICQECHAIDVFDGYNQQMIIKKNTATFMHTFLNTNLDQ